MRPREPVTLSVSTEAATLSVAKTLILVRPPPHDVWPRPEAQHRSFFMGGDNTPETPRASRHHGTATRRGKGKQRYMQQVASEHSSGIYPGLKTP